MIKIARLPLKPSLFYFCFRQKHTQACTDIQTKDIKFKKLCIPLTEVCSHSNKPPVSRLETLYNIYSCLYTSCTLKGHF